MSLQRLAYASATNIVANSRASASQLRAEGVAERKIAVVPNGLDLEPMPPRPGVRGCETSRWSRTCAG